MAVFKKLLPVAIVGSAVYLASKAYKFLFAKPGKPQEPALLTNNDNADTQPPAPVAENDETAKTE